MARTARLQRSVFFLSALGLAAALCAQAGAQTTEQPSRETSRHAARGAATQRSILDMRASQLIGMDVRNARGQDLGEIEDLVVDINNGRVHYAVLSFGGFLDIGDKLFAYPLRVFRTAPGGDALVLDLPRETLEKAPGFAADRWPDWADANYRGEVDRYFGATVTIRPRPDMQLVRASRLIGMDVSDRSGEEIGEVEDFVVRLSDGRIHYAVMEFDRAWTPNDKLIPLPLSAARLARDRDELLLNVDRSLLAQAPGIDANAWPDINDVRWRSDVDHYLAVVVPLPSTTNDALFAQLDANRDGVLSEPEAKANPGVDAQWNRLDRDSDGVVARAEFDAAYRFPAPEGGQARQGGEVSRAPVR